MSDIVTESANFVLAHLLSKDGQLSINDIKVIQTGILETKNADFPYANGSFGPGTAAGVMKFLAQEENLHIVPRLSAAAKDSLASNGHEESLQNLEKLAIGAGHDPSSLQGDTVKSLIAQPYPLSQEELKFIQKEFHKQDLYKLEDDEFTKYADGSPMKVHPNGLLGHNTTAAAIGYVRQNPDAILANPQMLGNLKRLEAYDQSRRDVADVSKAHGELTKDLIQNHTGKTMSTVNYRLEQALYYADYTGYVPDGAIGDKGLQDIENYKIEADKHTSLGPAWDNKGTEHAALDAPPGSEILPFKPA